jgi:osmotically-inducible protein OsmY/peroxiredoxin
MRTLPRLLLCASLAATAASLSGCFTLAATGVAAGALAVIDRRTVGAQAEDEAIELKAANRVRSAGLGGRISVASHNRRALIVGQVPDEATRQRAEQIVQGVENVRGVHNELQVSGRVGLATYSSDALITTKVKAAYVDAKDLQTQTIKVVTENGVVFLMGLVTQREAERAAQVASPRGRRAAGGDAVRADQRGGARPAGSPAADAGAVGEPVGAGRRALTRHGDSCAAPPLRRAAPAAAARASYNRAMDMPPLSRSAAMPASPRPLAATRGGPGRPPRRQAGRGLAVVAGGVAALAVAGWVGWSTLRAEPAPAVTYALIDGARVSQQDLRGKVVLVNFWATSCVTCVKEMPGLVDTWRKFQGRGFETVAVAMSYDRPDYVVNYVQTRKIPFKVAIDLQGQVASAFGDVAVTPTSYLIDRDGTILKRWVGEPDFAQLHALIDRKLGS